MAELFKYVCKSCGANLDPTSDEKVIKCSFCGSVYDRTAVLDEHRRREAEALTKKVKKYKADLVAYNGLKADTLRLADEVTRLSDTPTQMPLWTMLTIPAQLAGCALLLVMMYAAYKADSKPMMFLVGLLFAVLMVALTVADVKKKRLKRETEDVKGQLRSRLDELNTARAVFEDFERGFDIDFIASPYREYAAIDYLIGLLGTYQASKLGEAYRLFDLHEHFTKMEKMQSEQVEVQKQQLEVMQQLADYDFDDTYDDDDFTLHETLKAFRESHNSE